MAAFPSITLLLAAAAGSVFLLAQYDARILSLLYSRPAIADGELWRLLSGHLVHFSWAHLVADIAAFTLLGVLIEREQGKMHFAALLVFLASGTSAALWLCVPELKTYGGISALNYGLLTWNCLARRERLPTRSRWLAALLPVLMLAHILWQRATESSLLDAHLPQALRVAWQAHLAGLMLAFAAAGLRGIRLSLQRCSCGAVRGKPLPPRAASRAQC